MAEVEKIIAVSHASLALADGGGLYHFNHSSQATLFSSIQGVVLSSPACLPSLSMSRGRRTADDSFGTKKVLLGLENEHTNSMLEALTGYNVATDRLRDDDCIRSLPESPDDSQLLSGIQEIANFIPF
ncbi:MAG: hypothetical protein M1837_002282 [Sclerophora amabilis]|nr:MAG: hypothetical protein M1837_002282 [Sclerophora amabilis]